MNIGFCVLYRWKIVPGKEKQFRRAWEILTREIRDHEGGLGSRLHRASDGTWVAYAQWPNRQTWEEAAVKTEDGRAAQQMLSDIIEQRMEPITLEPVSDFLIAAQEGSAAG